LLAVTCCVFIFFPALEIGYVYHDGVLEPPVAALGFGVVPSYELLANKVWKLLCILGALVADLLDEWEFVEVHLRPCGGAVHASCVRLRLRFAASADGSRQRFANRQSWLLVRAFSRFTAA